MEANTNDFESITSSTESENVAVESVKHGTNIEEHLILEGKTKTDNLQQEIDSSREYGDDTVQMENEDKFVSQSETESTLTTEITNVTSDTCEKPLIITSTKEQDTPDMTFESVSYIDETTNDNVGKIEDNFLTDVNFKDFQENSKTDAKPENNESGPTSAKQIQNNEDKHISISNESHTNKENSLEKIIEITSEDSVSHNLHQSEEQILENVSNSKSEVKQSDVNIEECNSAQQDRNMEEVLEIADEHAQKTANASDSDENKEIKPDSEQLPQDNIDKSPRTSEMEVKHPEVIEAIEEQIQSLHEPTLPIENVNNLNDNEFSITCEAVKEAKEIILDQDQNLCVQENTNTITPVEHTDLNESLVINNTSKEQAMLSEAVMNSDNAEKQVSSIIQEESTKTEKTISIAEAISRDFDETDSEDVDKPDNIEESQSIEVTQENLVVGVNISEQLQHGTVTVTDTAGQIYYVQSVQDLIVVENEDMPSTLDQPETLEVTVVSEVEEPVQTQAKIDKKKERPPIPSHILGRNIDNPVIDTFRNGKVPPKPRLGVKIPYKNLTSQIVSKDEIAREILERQKQKHKQTGQTTREVLFAKKLTQRLAKKIAPPTSDKVSNVALSKSNDETINNSDLLAILEGDGEDIKSASTSKSINALVEKNDQNLKKDQLMRTEVNKKQKPQSSPQISRSTEREIALKQLKELPIGPSKRRKPPSFLPKKKSREEPELQITVVENEILLEGDPPLHHSEERNVEKVVQAKIDDNKSVDVTTKLVESKLMSEQKKLVDVSSEIEKDPQKAGAIKPPITTKVIPPNIKHSEVKPEQLKQTVSYTGTKSETTSAILTVKNDETGTPSSSETKSNDTKKSDSQLMSGLKSSEINLKSVKVKESVGQALTTTESAVTVVKPKVDEVKQSVSHNIKDNHKKINESNNTLCKDDSVLSDAKEEFVERKHTSNPPVKTYARKRKSTEDSTIVSNIPDKKPAITQKESNIPPNTYVTKSLRVIKRKVIWDPDEPSTTRSLATRYPRPDVVKSEKPIKTEISVSKVEKKPIIKLSTKTEVSRSPTKSPDSQKTKKRLSEIDKLLMDEGAVNMLYAFKNVDDTTKKKKLGIISLDKAQRELMNKTNELKKDLKINSDKISPKSLRRKDSPVPTPTKKVIPASVSRKKSKDSNRSSLHSPPASPSMIFLNHAEASRIIRRHSSSSYSSLEGEFEGEKNIEIIQTITPVDPEKTNKKRNASSNAESSSKSKKTKRSVDKENMTVIQKGETNEEASKSVSKVVRNENAKELRYEKYKTFSVKEMEHMVQIILLPSFNNEAYLTPEILNELCSIMKELQDDKNCTVVVISSSASSFCHGINYKTLISDKEQSRKTFARKLATCVTNFLRTLATFPKILVAGVHGDTVGLGVTILPLFDMVIASDTATFSIPNARLGCATEGGSLLSLPHLMHNVLVSELLYASRKLIAAEALRLGMVTRVLWPDKFQQELVSIVKSISNHSTQFMEFTKKQLRQHMMEHIEVTLNMEIDTLVQHWTSSECQKNFGVYG